MAGPFCGLLLADLGADVVKIENPKGGDYARALGPFPRAGLDGAGFLRLNRNKRSLALDLKRESGKAAFRALARDADVLVENFRPGTMDDLGVGYAALSGENPRVVYIAISGFGATGRDRERPGLDLIVQAESGLMSITGEEDGTPVKVGVPIADLTCGLYGALAAVSALRQRERSGRGAFVDLALHDAALSLAVWESGVYWTTGEVPRPLGSAHRVDAPYQAFATKDGHIAIGATSPPNWSAFLRVAGLGERLGGVEWDTAPKRRARYQELARIIEEVTRTRRTEEWFGALSGAGVPCGRLRTYDQVLTDPTTRERGMVVELPHPALGSISSLGSPIRFAGEPLRREAAAPSLGQHTREVLRAYFSDSELDRLAADGAIREA